MKCLYSDHSSSKAVVQSNTSMNLNESGEAKLNHSRGYINMPIKVAKIVGKLTFWHVPNTKKTTTYSFSEVATHDKFACYFLIELKF